MGSLKDELLKAKVVSKKEVKKSDHEERIKKEEVGKDEVRQEKEKFRQEVAKEKEERKKEDRKREESLRREKEKREKLIQLEQRIRENAVREAFTNSKRFHFVAANGGLPYLEVSDDMARSLERGRLAIIEIPQEKFSEFFIVPDDIARDVLKALPDWVRLFNK